MSHYTFVSRQKCSPASKTQNGCQGPDTHQGQHRLVRNVVRPKTSNMALQPKLTVGAVNDKYEQEADRVADQVMRMPDADVAQQIASDVIQPLKIQRVSPQRKVAALINQLSRGEFSLQAKGESTLATDEIPSDTESKISGLKSCGQPLDLATRQFFEPRFGHDFSNVRVHTNSQAAETAKSINARAFTLGNHVVLGDGQYQPSSTDGRKLLGHELTHVIQQGATQQAGADTAPKRAVQRDILDLALHGLLENLGFAFGPDIRDANLIAAAFNAVESSNVLFASGMNIPSSWQTTVAAYFYDHPLMGAFPFRALARLPIFYQGGWIMNLQPGAGAMTLDTSVFVSGNLSLATYVHELVHVTQYLVLSKTGFLASYFGMSAATVVWRWLNGQPTNAMRSSPHEEQAYQTGTHFENWYLNKYGSSARNEVI